MSDGQPSLAEQLVDDLDRQITGDALEQRTRDEMPVPSFDEFELTETDSDDSFEHR